MGEFFIAVIALIGLFYMRAPGKVYEIASEYYSQKLQESVESWKELVTIDTDEEHAILTGFSEERLADYSKYEARRAEFEAFLDSLKEQYPGYTGGYGHDRNTGLPERVEDRVSAGHPCEAGKVEPCRCAVRYLW